MRQRGNNYLANTAKTAPNVLKFECTLVADGRKLPRPVNYGLVCITPPAGAEIDPKKRPFVVINPRAGHGPGIGGFKADSEIGVALKGGHPCYFVGFLPEPMPGQTIDEERALGAIPSMLAKDRVGAARSARDLQQMIEVVGPKTKAAKARLAEIEPIFGAVGGTSVLDVERLGEAVSVGLQTGTSPRSRNAKKTAA